MWSDPRLPGEGQLAGQHLLHSMGEDYLKKLLGEQKIVYSSNRRQDAEWLVRGRYPIRIAFKHR